MIPTTKAYTTSKVVPAHSRAEVEVFLDKYKITKTMWVKDNPENTYIVFEKKFPGIDKAIAYKVQVPFIEKKTGGKWNKTIEYDELRSYRFFFHIFKSMLLNADIGMEFEQIFGNYMVVGTLADGTPQTIQDRITTSLLNSKNPALEFKEKKD